MDLVKSVLPTLPGLLPKWVYFISVVSVFNSVQTYISGVELSKKVYEAKPEQVTPLSARTFGTWTLFSAVIRCYGSLHLNNEHVYFITLTSFVIAIAHFGIEWFVYKTCRFGKGLLGPLIVSTTSIVWMLQQRDYYLSL